eukprot:scaffold2408_cov386-Prasinococcus_capsulatus_cf.AAC.2
MFRNTFQSGFLSIFYSLGSNPLQLWRTEVCAWRWAGPHGRARPPPRGWAAPASASLLWCRGAAADGGLRAPLAQIQSDVLELRGENLAKNFAECPGDPSKTLGIKLPFLTLLLKPLEEEGGRRFFFSFEVQSVDNTHATRRFRGSNYETTAQNHEAVCTLPLTLSKARDDPRAAPPPSRAGPLTGGVRARAQGWNTVTMDLADFTKRAYGTVHQETQRVKIHANCRVRRVFFSDQVYPPDALPTDFKLFLPLEKH